MPLMMGRLYHALIHAKVPEAEALAAAEEAASFENRVASVESTLTVIQWMVGTNIALNLIVLGRLFTR